MRYNDVFKGRQKAKQANEWKQIEKKKNFRFLIDECLYTTLSSPKDAKNRVGTLPEKKLSLFQFSE